MLGASVECLLAPRSNAERSAVVFADLCLSTSGVLNPSTSLFVFPSPSRLPSHLSVGSARASADVQLADNSNFTLATLTTDRPKRREEEPGSSYLTTVSYSSLDILNDATIFLPTQAFKIFHIFEFVLLNPSSFWTISSDIHCELSRALTSLLSHHGHSSPLRILLRKSICKSRETEASLTKRSRGAMESIPCRSLRSRSCR